MNTRDSQSNKGKKYYFLGSGIFWILIAILGYFFDPKHLLVIYSLIVLGLIHLIIFTTIQIRHPKK